MSFYYYEDVFFGKMCVYFDGAKSLIKATDLTNTLGYKNGQYYIRKFCKNPTMLKENGKGKEQKFIDGTGCKDLIDNSECSKECQKSLLKWISQIVTETKERYNNEEVMIDEIQEVEEPEIPVLNEERKEESVDIKIFNYVNKDVRVIEKDGEPWWVLKDVCDILDIKNVTQIAERLDSDERSMFNIGRQGEANVVNEPGLYSVILQSRKPEAKAFKKWITSEVLPSIRKHGAYMTPATIDEMVANPDLLIKLATTLKEEQEKNRKLKEENKVQQMYIVEAEPKLSYYDQILNDTGTILVTTIAKDYGKTGIWLNKFLKDNGVQYKSSKKWYLYKKYSELGYAKSVTQVLRDGSVAMHTEWTQKGRLFIYELLKKNGIFPVGYEE